MAAKKIVLLAGIGHTSTLLYNAIHPEFAIHTVIFEQAPPRFKMLTNRAHKIGWITVIFQVLFQIFIYPILKKKSKNRVKEIIANANLNQSAIPQNQIVLVNSANGAKCIEQLQQINPDIVLVNGTRILSKKLLNSIPAIFINMHAGITPLYRGVHGGYWALTQRDLSNCGVTIHKVDAGVDTGDTLYQQTIEITSKDNFCTYPYLQFVAGLPLLKQAIRDLPQLQPKRDTQQTKSKQWYHPTLFQYIYFRIVQGVR